MLLHKTGDHRRRAYRVLCLEPQCNEVLGVNYLGEVVFECFPVLSCPKGSVVSIVIPRSCSDVAWMPENTSSRTFASSALIRCSLVC